MTFRLKTALCLVCLVALLFGGGSTALISLSFQGALALEEASAKRSYDLLLYILQLVDREGALAGRQDVVQAIGQFSDQWSPWAALTLQEGTEIFFSQGAAAPALSDLARLVDQDHHAQTLLTHRDKHYLQLSSQLTVGGKVFLLNAAYDITPVYDTRQQQQRAYSQIFLGLLAVCAGLSYTIAWVLTRPLSKLSQTAQALGAGDLSARSGVRTQDELGALAREFDAMAQRQEEQVTTLQTAMAAQDRFIGSFTHELKTPMTSILGYADLLRRGTLSPREQAKAADYIFSEAKRLERLSLKLLELYTAQHQAFPLVPASPLALLREAAAPLVPALAREGIALTLEGEEGEALLEPDLFRSLLLNLIDNSRKAMDGGGTIQAAVTMTEGGCTLTLRDTGRGMPPEVLDHLTEAFYRVDKSRSRAQGGAGLGLALCQRIAALHGGSLAFESSPGQGTTVTVTLEGGRP